MRPARGAAIRHDASPAGGGDTAQNSFQGYFPLGSATSQLYHVSWGTNEAGPCRDHGAAPAEPTFVGPAEDTCILTKFYETCPDTPDGDPTGPWNTPAAVTIGALVGVRLVNLFDAPRRRRSRRGIVSSV